jgi:hypothetical protein
MATGETPTREAQRSFGSHSPRLRWQWQAVLWKSVAPLAIFVGLGTYSGYVLRDPAFELNCSLTRSVYLVAATVMLGYLTTYEAGTHGARRAGGANGNNGGQPAPRARPSRWAAPKWRTGAPL